MKKIKLFIIQIFLFSCLIISNSFSKALPPGSGVADVPANVLILLDKSGSMSATSYSGANINRPYSITPISNTGNYITHDGSTIYGVNHSANANTSIVGSRNTYRLRQRFPECSTYYDNGQNVLYHNNHIYFTGKYFYHGSPAFCKVNTTTGVRTKIINIGIDILISVYKNIMILFLLFQMIEELHCTIHQPIKLKYVVHQEHSIGLLVGRQ